MFSGADDTIANDKRMTPAHEYEKKNRRDLIESLDMQQAVLILERRQILKTLNKTIASERLLLVLMLR